VTARDTEDNERRLFRRKRVDRLKKELPLAKAPVQKFRSDEEAADYFEMHSAANVWNQLPAASPQSRPGR
jgi:hypothetical protein